MENGLISVNRWAEGSQAYFLTHLHADHTQGLSSTWSHGPLFCSHLTAKLLPFEFPHFDLSLLTILGIGTSHTLSLRSPSSGSPTTVHVTAIDACHCPGSVMLLFRGEFGIVLYTGYFRWERASEKAWIARDMLRGALKDDDGVDVLYLDNTYSTYKSPPRHIAAQQVIDIILSHPDHDVIIGVDTLGKEDLLLEISRTLKMKIWVWPECLQTMNLLGFKDTFTTDKTLTRVRAVPQCSFSVETLEALNTMLRPTIGIMPSGLPWIKTPPQKRELLPGSFLTSCYKRGRWSENSGVQIDKKMENKGLLKKLHQYMYSVPYSDHSNFEEIEDFIKLIRPTSIKGIVSSSSCFIDPMYYFGRLCRVNKPTEQLHYQHIKKESGKIVAAASSETTFGGDDDCKLNRNRGKNLKFKFSDVRVSGFNTLRKKHCVAKIQKINTSDKDL